MEATQTQRHSRPVVRIAMVAGVGSLGILFWMLASLLFGGSAAHADTTSPGDHGLLGGITGTVSTVTKAVTGTVSTVTSAVTKTTTDTTSAVSQTTKSTVEKTSSEVGGTASHTVQKATDAVAEIPVVGKVAAPVVHTVQSTVKKVTTKVVEPVLAPVVKTVDSGVVKPVVDPVVKVVTAVPVVGDVVHSTGLDSTLTGIAGAVDDTLGTVVSTTTGAVTGTVIPIVTGEPVASAPGATFPGDPGTPPIGGTGGGSSIVPPITGTSSWSPDPGQDAAATSATTPGTARVTSDAVMLVSRAVFSTATVAASGIVDTWTSPASAPANTRGPLSDAALAACAMGGSCSFGSSGAAAGAAGALSALAFVAAYRAWMRRRGVIDDRVPHAPVYATDTSPD